MHSRREADRLRHQRARPADPGFLAGTRLARIAFGVPQAGSVGLGVSIFSYDGAITVGVAADAGLVDDPRVLVQGVEAELAELSRLARP
jgi:diacylglycerol O-acyltransferase